MFAVPTTNSQHSISPFWEMARAFVQDEPRGVLEKRKQWGRTFSPISGPWGDNMRHSSPVGMDIARPFNLYVPPTKAPKRPWDLEKQPEQWPSASDNELHIFCPTQAGAQRRWGKSLNWGRHPSTQRRTQRPSPINSPSKFELAAVAALCKPRSTASPSRCRLPPVGPFPCALSFVPCPQLPCGNPAVGGGFAAVHNTPGATIRRPDRGNSKGHPKQDAPTHNGPLMQAQLIPLSLASYPHPQWEARHPFTRDCGSSYPRELEQATMDGDIPVCYTFDGHPNSVSSFGWSGQPLDVSHTRRYSPRRPECPMDLTTAGNATNKGLPYMGITKPPLASTVVYQGINEGSHRGDMASTALWRAPLSLGYPSFGRVPMERQPDATSNEGAQKLTEEASADVVTVHGTDRFWQLMDILVELQRGPTSLVSSSVTFDSVVLPGGELQYSLIEQGSFGRVFVGSHQGSKVAIKVPVESMLRNDAAGVMERTLNEWQILSMCQHPNVVRLIGGIVHGPFDVWLVTQLVNGSDLHSRKYSRDPLVQRVITPANGLYMCRQLAAVVAYLHSPIPGSKPVVVHRDIKPENVLIADDWSIQLCDFGDAEASADGRVSRISGATWFYAPAELLRSSPVERMTSESGGQLPPFNEKWDIWSMGCVFQEMFGFLNPMHMHISSRDSPNTIYQKLKAKAIAGALIPDIANEIQGIARDIIARCLNPDPEARPSAAEVLEMWNASDDEILKDIVLGQDGYQGTVIRESGTCSSSRLQCCSGVTFGQQLLASRTVLPSALSGPRYNPGNKEWCEGDAVHGQLVPTATESSPVAASEELLSSYGGENLWRTDEMYTNTQLPVCTSRPRFTKLGTKCVQPQRIHASTRKDN